VDAQVAGDLFGVHHLVRHDSLLQPGGIINDGEGNFKTKMTYTNFLLPIHTNSNLPTQHFRKRLPLMQVIRD
jgi:hypothetical protein